MSDREEKRRYDREWRARNIAHVREYRRKYYADHKEQFRTYKKKRPKTSPLFDALQTLTNPLAIPCIKRKCLYLNENGIPSCDYIKYNGPRPCPGGEECTVWKQRRQKENDNKESE